ncbi:hypothetical protein Tsubulata_037796 [Turnera subulata]|uniref:Uncharacterized protein n=1 Tax=Turnera subulata TaxID=218843 RepID=A0A9Q0JEX2_9ROSI|nr:hypothetical protein Tsubulata_037796 [Turnera subulata]
MMRLKWSPRGGSLVSCGYDFAARVGGLRRTRCMWRPIPAPAFGAIQLILVLLPSQMVIILPSFLQFPHSSLTSIKDLKAMPCLAFPSSAISAWMVRSLPLARRMVQYTIAAIGRLNLVRKIKAYDHACIDVEFHPVFPDVIASCSWNGDVSVFE